MTEIRSAGSSRVRGPELLQTRFAERLRELLPGGHLALSRTVVARDTPLAGGESAGRLTWVNAGQSIEFETWVDLTLSPAKLQALPTADRVAMPIPVLLAPQLSVRSCLRLEQMGWSYFTGTGVVLIQHHEPLIFIRVTAVRPTVGDRRARAAHERRIADPRGR